MNNQNNFLERKKQLATAPGSFVIISNTLESKYYLSRIIEYDRLVSWIKKRIGVNIDTDEALNLIKRCQEHEKQFGQLLNDLKSFVRSYVEPPSKKKQTPDNGSGLETESSITGNGSDKEDKYNPVAEAVVGLKAKRTARGSQQDS